MKPVYVALTVFAAAALSGCGPSAALEAEKAAAEKAKQDEVAQDTRDQQAVAALTEAVKRYNEKYKEWEREGSLPVAGPKGLERTLFLLLKYNLVDTTSAQYVADHRERFAVTYDGRRILTTKAYTKELDESAARDSLMERLNKAAQTKP